MKSIKSEKIKQTRKIALHFNDSNSFQVPNVGRACWFPIIALTGARWFTCILFLLFLHPISQGLSYHGWKLGIPVTVVMPLKASLMKIQKCRDYHANVIVQVCGTNWRALEKQKKNLSPTNNTKQNAIHCSRKCVGKGLGWISRKNMGRMGGMH